MYLIKPGWKNLRMGIVDWDAVDGLTVLKVIEEYGRKCYKSEGKATEDSAVTFVEKRLRDGHIAILDHLHLTAEYICDRGVSHEWLRHKLTEIFGSDSIKNGESAYDWKPMAVCQESTRYCNYMKRGGVVFVIPPWINVPEGEYNEMPGWNWVNPATEVWFGGCLESEYRYLKLIELGWTPQMARGDLAIKVKTEFVVTCSLTEWRHVMKQRTHNTAHPQMTELMRPQLRQLQQKIPVIFDDIVY